jgi:hypoxanthine phosphoribosyltransferase
MREDIERIFFDEEEINEKVKELGAIISADFKDKNPLLIGVLKGSFVFMAHLLLNISIDCEVDFMVVSSYGSSSTTTGDVKISEDLSHDIEGRHVIVVEDILDSGVTLNYLTHYLKGRNPASVNICTLLDKPSRRKVPIHTDYVGFTCPDVFIVGYGLDYAERYRNLPYIGALKPEIYS